MAGGTPTAATPHRFGDDLEWSRTLEDRHLTAIRWTWPNASRVERATPEQDRREGFDYVATFAHRGTLTIDAKSRRPGCRRYWQDARDPEVMLERWSRVPPSGQETGGRAGWAFDGTKRPDFYLFDWDPQDWPAPVLLPAAGVRAAVLTHGPEWRSRYGMPVQRNGGYRSAAVPVPLSELRRGMGLATGSIWTPADVLASTNPPKP